MVKPSRPKTVTRVFGPHYARIYDAIYSEKDYDRECRVLGNLFQKYARIPVRKILDLGCGTGSHALCLAREGYEVVGVDLSSSMLRIARSKARRAGVAVRFHHADVQRVRLRETFDAVLLMFAVLSYQTTEAAVLRVLRTARRHLHPAAIMIFDAWYGPAVLAQRPERRGRTITAPGGPLIRTVSGALDHRHRLCVVNVSVRSLRGRRSPREFGERHVMRYFFRSELRRLLAASGLSLLRLGAVQNVNEGPDTTTWSVLGIAGAAPPKTILRRRQ